MSLQIHVIPSGHSVPVPTPIPPSIDDLRIWIERSLKIPVADQIILNNKGKHLRPQNFLVDRELFLYDRAVFSTSGAALNNVNLAPIPSPIEQTPFPTDLADQKSLKAWQELFKQRREWANDILARCKSVQRSAEQLFAQRAVVEQGVRLATTSVEAPIKNIEKKLGDFRLGLEDTSKDTTAKTKTLEDSLKKLNSISALSSFSKFFVGQGTTGKSARKRSMDAMITLASLVDSKSARAAVKDSREMFSKFEVQINDFETSLKSLNQQLEETRRGLDIAHSRSMTEDHQEPQKLLDEIRAVVSKVALDCDKIAGLKIEPNAISQASRAALYHTKNLLPGLKDYAVEMSELLKGAVELKNAAVVRGADILQMVATVEARQNDLREAVNFLRMSEDDWAIVDRISIVSEIPLIYGSLLIEAIRRHEWVEKMRRDSANLAEEIAGYQDEESKRRKRWIRGMKDLVPDSMDGAVLGVEVNLRGEEVSWPAATRKDFEEYLRILQSIAGMSDTISYLNDLVKELDKPTRQQVKRVKAFKNGSVHEAGFGKGSLLLRGEDEGRVLKEVISKLEDELKSNKSRVRKLEDLLHRQSQINRLSGNNSSPSQNFMQSDAAAPHDYTDRPPSVTSPRSPVIGSRRPSVASRRFSNQPVDDKTNIRRILQLEAELAEEKLSKANLQKELQSKEDEIITVWDELSSTKSTKKDIMDNMDARQKEFAEERKGLEDEIRRFKLKVEEVEDELDRVVGSRENERTSLDTRTDQLMVELEQTRRVGKDEIRALERQLEAQTSEKARNDVEVKDLLSGLFSTMAPEVTVPTDFSNLMVSLEEAARRSIDQAKELKRTIAIVQSENENLQGISESLRIENSTLGAQIELKEAALSRAKEEVASEKAKADSITAQLEEERTHLKALRDKFAEGETGSEELRLQLASQEGEVTKLSTQLAQQKSHINGLDVALIASQSRYNTLQNSHKALVNRANDRAQRAKELTHRIYKQNERLFGLLESMGFAITYENGSMVIQRASKVGTSSILPDQSAQLASPPVTLSPAKKLLEDLSDLSSLSWMEKESDSNEAKTFAEFLSKVDKFDIDTFCDGISKRMRDIEHTARKWQRDCRGYRDKARKYQTDAHDKIAYRSFKEGDLALFLPTRNQATRPWAAFNVNAPHYFLREQDSHRLGNKEWLIARIGKIEERLVDLSRTADSTRGVASTGDVSEAGMSIDTDDNPFQLDDGLRWWLIDAQEEKPGAPSTPGPGRTTVAAANVDATASFPRPQRRPGETNEVSRQLNKSLDSRRSSTNSKKGEYLSAALGIRRPVSNEAIEPVSPAQSPAANKSFAPSHLRSASQASSLRQVKSSSDPAVDDTPVAARTESHEQEEDKSRNGSGLKGAIDPVVSDRYDASHSPAKTRDSPTKRLAKTNSSSSDKTPDRSNAKGRGATWDSLWQFGVNFESGGQKKT